MKGILPLLTTLLILPGLVSATDYYVSNEGSDSNNGCCDPSAGYTDCQGCPGTDGPWKTIPNVNSELAAGKFSYGDQILFREGDTWDQPDWQYGINILSSSPIGGTGSEANRLRFGSYGSGAAPVISHNDPVHGQAAFRVLKDYIEIDGFDIRESGTGIYASGMSYSLIENCNIEGAHRGIWLNGYCDHNIIQYNMMDAKEDVYDYSESAYSVSYEGITMVRDGWNTAHGGRTPANTAQAYNVIRGNVIMDWGHAEIGIYGGDYNEIYDNYLYDNYIPGTFKDTGGAFGLGNGRNNKVYNNWCETVEYVRICGQNNEVYNNVFKMIFPPERSDNVNNILLISPNDGDPFDNCYNKIYNNIFYGSYEWYVHAVESAPWIIIKKQNYLKSIHHNEYVNNIVLEWRQHEGHEADTAVFIHDEGGAGDITDNVFRNNTFYSAGVNEDSSIIRHQEFNFYTVSEWNSADPGGNIVEGNVFTDPGLANPASGQFWAAGPDSSVVDAGYPGYLGFGLDSSSSWAFPISVVTNPRGDGNPTDIGPYELKEESSCGDSACGEGECLSCPLDCTLSDCHGNGQCDSGLQDGDENCLDDPGDCPCTGSQICCSGECVDPACTQDQDCGTGPCMIYTCSSPGTCSASCSSTEITECVDGDGCCPAGCTEEDDSDCLSDTALVARWTFDSQDISGSTALDVSGSGNHGTISGAVPARGRIGDALKFDGQDDYVEAAAEAFNTDYLTVSLWFMPEGFTDNAGLFAKGDNAHRQYWAWVFMEQLSLEIDGEGSHNLLHPLKTDEWHHLAVTYNGSDIKAYINGTEAAGISQSTGPILADDDPLRIGNLPGFGFFNGTIDEVVLWNRSLTSQEILGLYESSFHEADTSPKDGCVDGEELTNFISLWKLDSTVTPMPRVMEAVGLFRKGTGCVS